MTTKTNPEQASKDIEEKLQIYLESDKGSKRLENHLSNELKHKLHLEKIEAGSIFIVIRLSSLDCLERLHYLSTTDYLSNTINHLLITKEFLTECAVSSVILKVTLLEESYQRLLLTARGKPKLKLYKCHIQAFQ